ncbi:MAG: sulfotransferase family 2 domain-containing protein [Bacteroidota bacterium]
MAWRIARKMLQRAKAVTSNPKPDGNWLIQQKNQSALGIFVHIHKCAGSSLVQAFIDNPHVISCIARPGIFPGRTGREKIPDELFDRCMKFTIVRNPYARLVSAYRMFKSSVRWEPLFPTFDDFVDFIQWTDVHEHEVKNEISIDDFMKRTEYIVHHCSSFHNPKYMIDQMDYVGRIETLNEDLKKIAEMLNIAPIQVNHLNKRGQAYNYRDYYSTNSKNLVGKIYQRDIERFKYQF